MKRIACAVMMLFMMLSLTCCIPAEVRGGDKIVSPSNNQIPISGEWKVVKFVAGGYPGLTDEEAGKWLGRTGIFDSRVAVFDEEICVGPDYKVKNVDSSDYFLYQYKVNPDYVGIQDSKIQVVTVMSKDGFFYEFIKASEDSLIVNVDGVFFYLEKNSDSVDEKSIEEYMKKAGRTDSTDKRSENRGANSGVLLGLRYYKKTGVKSSEGKWDYRTIWISSRDMVPGTIYGTQGLFVPRKSGFWRVGVKNREEGRYNIDTLFAYAVGKETEEEDMEGGSYIENQNIQRTILYVGNDYVSTEYQKGEGPGSQPVFQVLPLDNIEHAMAVKISDIAGEGGVRALNEGFISHMKDKDELSYTSPREESFALSRRNGHWIMKGRLNLTSGDVPYMDFNIKSIPPSNLVVYDELCLSWREIKERIPEAVDAYTSPNEDIAVIITGNAIWVYNISNRRLSEKLLKKIRLKEGETVVMAEWASGKYTDKWEREFLKNDTVELGQIQ